MKTDQDSSPRSSDRGSEWRRTAMVALAAAAIAGMGVAAVYEFTGGGRVVAFDLPSAALSRPSAAPSQDADYAATATALRDRLGLTAAPADDAFWRSQPPPPPQPLAAAQATARDEPLADVDSMVAALEQRLAAAPEDARGWRMLGWSHQRLGRREQAVEAYRRALALAPEDAQSLTGLGEAMVERDGGAVSDEALGLFSRAVEVDPANPPARFFLGQRKLQDGDAAAAIDDWIALLRDAPADADWTAGIEQKVREAAAQAGVDLAGRLPRP